MDEELKLAVEILSGLLASGHCTRHVEDGTGRHVKVYGNPAQDAVRLLTKLKEELKTNGGSQPRTSE